MIAGNLTKGNPYFYSTYEFCSKVDDLRGCKVDDQGELRRTLVERRVDHHHMQKMCKSR